MSTITIRLEHVEMVHYTDLRDGKGYFAYRPPQPLDPGATPEQKREWEASRDAVLREREVAALASALWRDNVRERIGNARIIVLERKSHDEPRWQEVA